MSRMAVSDSFEYTDEDSISERLKCPICSNPFVDPVKTKCKPKEHTFCRICIEEWLQRDLSCPICRQNIKVQQLTPITEGILLEMLNELSVQCSVCKKTGLERGNLDEHLTKRCAKQNILCSSADIKCPWKGPQKELDKHLQTCPYTLLRPMITWIITENRQLNEQVNQQKTLIDKLQKENRQSEEQQKIPILKSSSDSRQIKPPRPLSSRPMPPPKVSCNNCSDCWRGAVRGTYFRGQAGGGLQAGTTLLSCDCNCHK